MFVPGTRDDLPFSSSPAAWGSVPQAYHGWLRAEPFIGLRMRGDTARPWAVSLLFGSRLAAGLVRCSGAVHLRPLPARLFALGKRRGVGGTLDDANFW